MRVFISSPGDVKPEREIADRILRRLAARYEQLERFEVFRSEYHPSLGVPIPSQAQMPNPVDFDLLICIVWTKMGTPLPAELPSDAGLNHLRGPDGEVGLTGTEYEFAWALHGWRTKGFPRLLVYRKRARTADLELDSRVLEERLVQLRRVEDFERRFKTGDGTYISARHSFTTTDEFAELFEVHARQLIIDRLREKGHSAESVDKARPIAIWAHRCPFRGLSRFEFEHSPVFFGRDRMVREITARLGRRYRGGNGFLLTIGGSGAGKSSLLRAGVAAQLVSKRAGDAESGNPVEWRVALASLDESDNPQLAVAQALLDSGESLAADAHPAGSPPVEVRRPRAIPELARQDLGDVPALARRLDSDPGFVAARIEQTLASLSETRTSPGDVSAPREHRLLLLIDQFEQLFRSTTTTAQRDALVHLIHSLATNGRVWVIVALRSDFYGHLQSFPKLMQLKGADGQFDVTPPTPFDVEAIVRQAADAAGLEFERESDGADLADVIIGEATAQPASLPLIEFALEELYLTDCLRADEGEVRRAVRADTPHVRRGDRLNVATYRSMQGLGGAISKIAGDFDASLDAEETNALHQLFWRIIEYDGASGQATTVVASLDVSQLAEPSRRVIERAIDARLLVGSDDPRKEIATRSYRLTHESLLSHWPRLRNWLADHRELLDIRRRIVESAERWNAAGRPRDQLLNAGRPLREGLRLVESSFESSLVAESFVTASAAYASRRNRLRQIAVIALAISAVVSVCLALLANYQRRELAELFTQEHAKFTLHTEYRIAVATLADGGVALRGESDAGEYLADAQAWRAMMQHAKRLQDVRQLELPDVPLEEIDELDSLPDLQRLRFSGWSALKRLDLRGHPRLREVAIVECPMLHAVTGLDQCRDLRVLDLTDAPRLVEFGDIESCSSLETLKLAYCEELAESPRWAAFPALRELDISASKIVAGQRDLRFLGKLPLLESLNVSLAPLSSLDGIAEAPRLQTLYCGSCEELEDIESLTQLKELRDVQLTRCKKLATLMPFERCVRQLKVEISRATEQKFLTQVQHLRERGILFDVLDDKQPDDLPPEFLEPLGPVEPAGKSAGPIPDLPNSRL